MVVFLVSRHGHWVRYPHPLFLSVSLLESMRSGGAIPPPQKGYLSDTCAIPYETRQNACNTPPLRYYLERELRAMGGYLTLAAKPVCWENPLGANPPPVNCRGPGGWDLPFSTQTLPTEKKSGGINFGEDYSMITD